MQPHLLSGSEKGRSGNGLSGTCLSRNGLSGNGLLGNGLRQLSGNGFSGGWRKWDVPAYADGTPPHYRRSKAKRGPGGVCGYSRGTAGYAPGTRGTHARMHCEAHTDARGLGARRRSPSASAVRCSVGGRFAATCHHLSRTCHCGSRRTAGAAACRLPQCREARDGLLWSRQFIVALSISNDGMQLPCSMTP